MNTKNWRIRTFSDDKNSMFFIEADLPDAEKNGHYPKIELMMEDYGDHNGYTREIRMADAKLIVAAPIMLEALQHIVEYWNRDRNDKAMHDALWHIIEVADEAIKKAID